jgi:hypothetical protein
VVTPGIRSGLAALGEDLLLLAVKPNNVIGPNPRIASGLIGSQLIRLAAAGRVEIAGDRILVRSRAPTGDTELDGALAGLPLSREPLQGPVDVLSAAPAGHSGSHDSGSSSPASGHSGHQH